MQEQEQNRTEQATPFKLSEAKKRGQVAKSLDFNSLVIVCGLLFALVVWGESQWARFCSLCAELFSASAALQVTQQSLPAIAGSIAAEMLAMVLPFAAAGFVFAVLANIVQTGPILSGDPLKPKFERLNPVAGFKRIFNKRMLFEGLKSVLKLGFFGLIAYAFFAALWPALPSVATSDTGAQMQWLGDSTVALLFRLGLALVVVGLLDMVFVRWQYKKQMMMSPREVKEEVKRREGDPLIRAKIRELQRENRKQARSLNRVKEADVLITNPEHLAIALRYDRLRMSAPVVIAKGVDASAAEMRTLAERHGVPKFERRRLARLLFRRVGIDQPIPAECFVDVARVYAEVNERKRDLARYEVRA
jgi:flagellar biosynthesis protein FlhB